jgi:hypothetical protein
MDKVGDLFEVGALSELGVLSDQELLARLREHVGKGHVWQARLIAYLAEVEDRRLDLVHACSSMWDFCTRKLRMSESEAHRRLTASRIVRRFPHVLGYLQRGEIHLCALYALHSHLTNENVDELLREALGKSTREVEQRMAARFPRPDVPTRVEPVAPQVPLPVVPLPVASSDTRAAWAMSLAGSPAAEPRWRVEPHSATRYRIELTVSAETKATLERIKDLMRHRNPAGDLETIVDASFALLLAKLEKERLGKTSRPRKGTTVDMKAPTFPAEYAGAEIKTGEPDTTAHAEASMPKCDRSAHDDPNTEDRHRSAHDDPNTEDRAAPARSRQTARAGYVSREVRREVFARDVSSAPMWTRTAIAARHAATSSSITFTRVRLAVATAQRTSESGAAPTTGSTPSRSSGASTSSSGSTCGVASARGTRARGGEAPSNRRARQSDRPPSRPRRERIQQMPRSQNVAADNNADIPDLKRRYS